MELARDVDDNSQIETKCDNNSAVLVDLTKADEETVKEEKQNQEPDQENPSQPTPPPTSSPPLPPPSDDDFVDSNKLAPEQQPIISIIAPTVNATNNEIYECSNTNDYNSCTQKPKQNEQFSKEESPVKNKEKEKDKANEKQKEKDDKLSIYKALAVKLKRDLVKTRDEFSKLQDASELESKNLGKKIASLEESLQNERHISETTRLSYDAMVQDLNKRLANAEQDLESLQAEYDSYKARAAKIMQEKGLVQFQSCKLTFDEDKYKQLKEINSEQKKMVLALEQKLNKALLMNQDIGKQNVQLQDRIERLTEELKSKDVFEEKYTKVTMENENLTMALDQFRSRLTLQQASASITTYVNNSSECTSMLGPEKNSIKNQVDEDEEENSDSVASNRLNGDELNVEIPTLVRSQADNGGIKSFPSPPLTAANNTSSQLSPISCDASTTSSISNYKAVIKTTPIEFASKSTALADAQRQINDLTKAYLESESTNSLLTNQVRALKDEIRRIERAKERMDLADKLEYLKNIVFKFLSLEGSPQLEQRRRLVPVLSTVLRLSPEETTKLNETLDKSGEKSGSGSIFKLPLFYE